MSKFRAIIHGSFNKHFPEIKRAHAIFTAAGIDVLAPEMSEISSFENGFAFFDGQEGQDPRMIELIYLHNLKKLGNGGFSYFVNPAGYIGKSASYELGIAQVTNVQCFFMAPLSDHPAYFPKSSVLKAEELADYIKQNDELPEPKIKKNDRAIHDLWQDLMVPGSVVAAGAIIEHESQKKEKEILLVKTHKWGGRYSMVGGKVRRNERLQDALSREVKEETGLRSRIGRHLVTFDQFKDSGYYKQGTQHIFVDNVVSVTSKRVTLNDEAQDYVWLPAKIALRELDIEPNARHTVELYAANS